ncbi:hypothetical protein U2F26_06255 [Micromonospora sp. 4G57]|uniref:Uncharacterized protein n=1 Tax=Micromonospora sicca TaxID=2202420 RepID=A0ABU5J9H6_9ACTN|nr:MULTISPECIES: hypothetical protein [unclassified Micromonospora]MDZ5442334.1 hypothetical protein [Micromonospora sp. 4G57]MDZ5489139.1 hypothetical protein [Micromonospora sp. 4G53]
MNQVISKRMVKATIRYSIKSRGQRLDVLPGTVVDAADGWLAAG